MTDQTTELDLTITGWHCPCAGCGRFTRSACASCYQALCGRCPDGPHHTCEALICARCQDGHTRSMGLCGSCWAEALDLSTVTVTIAGIVFPGNDDEDELHREEAQCQGCGCTDSMACVGGCTWAWLDIAKRWGWCSSCEADDLAAELEESRA